MVSRLCYVCGTYCGRVTSSVVNANNKSRRSSRRHRKRGDEHVDDGYEEHPEDHVVVELDGVHVGRATAVTPAVQPAFEYQHRSHEHLRTRTPRGRQMSFKNNSRPVPARLTRLGFPSCRFLSFHPFPSTIYYDLRFRDHLVPTTLLDGRLII